MFFDKRKIVRINKEIHDMIKDIYKHDQENYDSESHVIRSAIVYYYNKKQKEKGNKNGRQNKNL